MFLVRSSWGPEDNADHTVSVVGDDSDDPAPADDADASDDEETTDSGKIEEELQAEIGPRRRRARLPK